MNNSPSQTDVQLFKPIEELVFMDGVSELCVNEPGYVWLEHTGNPIMTRLPCKQITEEYLAALARRIAQSTHQKISQEKPLLSAVLHNGLRVQVVLSSANADHYTVMSFRKHNMKKVTLDDYESRGGFSSVNFTLDGIGPATPHDLELDKLREEGQVKKFVELAVNSKKNIIISGGTSSGKTTFANAMIHSIPSSERILTIEDSAELSVPHSNKVRLIASKGEQGIAKISTKELLEASLRLRPDRILLGELRGSEAFYFLRAINTGHPGSMTTLHADTPKSAIEQLCLMVMQADTGWKQAEIRKYIYSVIDIVIQLKRNSDGSRSIPLIWYPCG